MSKFRHSDPAVLKAMREKHKKKNPESELDRLALAAQTPFHTWTRKNIPVQKGKRRGRIKKSK